MTVRIEWVLDVDVVRDGASSWVARVLLPSGRTVQWKFAGPEDERLARDVACAVARAAFLRGQLGPRTLG